MKSIIFIAPPAAGKGTQAVYLTDKYNIPSISTGDLLREARNKDNELGRIIREKQDAGLLVDDEIVLDLLKQRISLNDCSNGYILDGFPRNVEQAASYEAILNELNKQLGYVIFIEVSKETAKNRILGRLSCPNCKRIFNNMVEESNPINKDICDYCNTSLIKRSDDNLETFEKRFDTYLEKTAPLINYYETKGVLYKVDGNVSKEYTTKQIENILNQE